MTPAFVRLPDAPPAVRPGARDVFARFWRKVVVSGGHWLWTGGADGDGYGSFRAHGRIVAAHRYAYEQLGRPIPSSIHLDHTCNVRRCVRHLEEVTHQENCRRRDARRRAR